MRTPSARSSLVCISCRSAKTKCDGSVPSGVASPSSSSLAVVQADVPCSRCQRLHIECSWRPAQRTGRPPKGSREKKMDARTEDGASQTDLSSTSSIFSSLCFLTTPSTHHHSPSSTTTTSPHDCDTTTFTATDLDSFLEQDIWNLSDDILLNGQFSVEQEEEEKSGWESSTPVNDYQDSATLMSQVMSDANDIFNSIPGAQAQSAMTVAPSTSSSSEPGTFAISNELRLGVQRYFASLGQCSPLIGVEGDFTARMEEEEEGGKEEEILVQIVAALGHLFFVGRDGASYQQARQRSLDLSYADFPSTRQEGASSVLDHISALILLAYNEYGSDNMAEADRCLSKAASLSLQYQLNLLDAPSSQVGEGTGGGDDLGRSRMRMMAETCKDEQSTLESCRRVWWELFIADTIIHIATSGRLKRHLGSSTPTAVNAPCIYGSMEQEVYEMRIRAAIMAGEITSSSNSQQSLPLSSVDSMLSLLISSVQDKWLNLTTRRTNVRAAESGQGGSQIQSQVVVIAQQVAFQALLMLHAARLHLHRQKSFPNMTLEYTSCSFQSRSPTISGDTSAAPQIETSSTIDLSSKENSRVQIIKCSSSILRLMQIDSEMHFRRAETTTDISRLPLISPQWPFIGCCQMAASFGFALATTTTTTTSTTSYSSTSSSSLLASTSMADVWKKREDLSRLGFAEATLANFSQVWRIAETYREEIYRCRMAIESSMGSFGGNSMTSLTLSS